LKRAEVHPSIGLRNADEGAAKIARLATEALEDRAGERADGLRKTGGPIAPLVAQRALFPADIPRIVLVGFRDRQPQGPLIVPQAPGARDEIA
jgi:hypothetical protein